MTSSTLSPTRHRDAALDAVSTVAMALREVIDGDPVQAKSLLSELPPTGMTAVLQPLAEVLGLLASVEAAAIESARKAAKR